METVKPYHSDDKNKKQEVEVMFDRISRKYDLLNRVLSLGIDRRWRKKALSMLTPHPLRDVLDVATGTGDLAFTLSGLHPGATITGIDLSAGMLQVAAQRAEKLSPAQKTQIRFIKSDAESMPFHSNRFDVVTVAFGVRNFANLQAGLQEMHRVLRSGGQVMVLEFTKPRVFPFKQLYLIYFRNILPLIGSWTSGDKRAYRYLFESVQAFPDFEKFTIELEKAGFQQAKHHTLSFGICAIYTAYKP